MLSDSVAQYPTIAVTQGTNSATNWDDDAGRPARERASARRRMVPRPPTLSAAQRSSASPVTMRNGADSVSSHLMLSVPARTKYRLISQKRTKLVNCGRPYPMNRQSPPSPSHPGHRMPSSALSASPPIHAWIPNHPHATTERSSDGTWAPRVPNAARAYTGNGIP